MAVTIKTQGQATAPPEDRQHPLYTRHPDIKPDQWEIYGRLDLTRKQISQLEGLSLAQVGQLMRRADLKAAWDKGRAQTIVALRQKQINLALGGSERMLIHTGLHFAEQGADGPIREPDTYEPSRHSWDAELRQCMEGMRAALEASVSEDD